jgi:hypothetical protein
MKHTIQTLLLGAITVGQNVRSSLGLRLKELAADIAANGLTTPIWVWEPTTGSGVFEVIRGHRRDAALNMLAQDNPARFAELFADGVPVDVISEITLAEALALKVDHGNELSLSSVYEVQLCCNLLFQAGHTEEAVVGELSGMLDRIAPMSPKVRGEIDSLRAAGLHAEADKREFGYRRGLIQGKHNAYRCPEVVMVSIAKDAGEAVPKAFEGQYIPSLTTGEITTLFKAFSKDQGILENGKAVFDRQKPGPSFKAAWDKVVAAKLAKDLEPEAVRAKAMSSKDMMQEVIDKKLKSLLGCKLTAKHAGDSQWDSEIPELDADALMAETVKAGSPELWAMIVEEFKKLTADKPVAEVVEA